MNREIKFRVWDTKESEYFEPIYEAQNGHLLDLSITLSGQILRRTLKYPAEHESMFPDRYLIEQFTGLHDKNGVDIYEGDIVQLDQLYIKPIKVYWNDEMTGFYPLLSQRAQTMTVIGNIHQTPQQDVQR